MHDPLVAEGDFARVGIDYQPSSLISLDFAAIALRISSTLEGPFAVGAVCETPSHVVSDPVRRGPFKDAAHELCLSVRVSPSDRRASTRLLGYGLENRKP